MTRTVPARSVRVWGGGFSRLGVDAWAGKRRIAAKRLKWSDMLRTTRGWRRRDSVDWLSEGCRRETAAGAAEDGADGVVTFIGVVIWTAVES